MKNILTSLFVATLALGGATVPAKAGTNPLIGDIVVVGENFCPRGWTEAAGQLLPIAQYTAVFSLLGTTFGGDGRTTFGLPDLRGRAEIGQGTGPGLAPRRWGQIGGSEFTASTPLNMASHTHVLTEVITSDVRATAAGPALESPVGAYMPTFPAGVNLYAAPGGAQEPMGAGSVTVTSNVVVNNTGSQRGQTNIQPRLGMRTCIALQGIYPSRN